MRITSTDSGHMVWLVPAEVGTEAAAKEIARLKEQGKVTILVSGQDSFKDMIGRLAKVESLNQ